MTKEELDKMIELLVKITLEVTTSDMDHRSKIINYEGIDDVLNLVKYLKQEKKV